MVLIHLSFPIKNTPIVLTYLSIPATETKIRNRTREKHALETKLEIIRRTRAELEEMGEASLIRFGDAINILAGTWKQTADDARIIQQWLADGADSTVSTTIHHSNPD